MPAKKKNKYFKTNSDKDRAVAIYATTGSFQKTADITGIHENTIRYWAKQPWFDEAIRRQDRSDSEEIKASLTKIIKRATSELEDRLENGDESLTKDGEVVKRKISGKDLAIITGIAVQKRKDVKDEPHSVPIQSSEEKLASLIQQFIKFANAKELNAKDFRTISEPITIEGEVKELGLCDSDKPIAESGGLEEGNQQTDPKGDSAREHDTSSPSEGQSSEILQGFPSEVKLQIQP